MTMAHLCRVNCLIKDHKQQCLPTGQWNSNTAINYLSNSISESCLSDIYGIFAMATALVWNIIKNLSNCRSGLPV